MRKSSPGMAASSSLSHMRNRHLTYEVPAVKCQLFGYTHGKLRDREESALAALTRGDQRPAPAGLWAALLTLAEVRLHRG